MSGSAHHTPEDDIEATAQQPIQDQNAPTDSDRSSLSDVAESAPQLPGDDIEAAVQQPVHDESPPAGGDNHSHSDELPELPYEQRLYEYTNPSGGNRFHADCLDFYHLSQINIVHLMNELAKYDQAMMEDKAAPQDIEHLGDLLHRYTTAVQDRGHWSKLSEFGGFYGRVFHINLLQKSFPKIYHKDVSAYKDVRVVDESSESKSGSIDPLRNFLRRILPTRLTWTEEEIMLRHDDYWEHKPPQGISPFIDTLARFTVAITGGLSLVIPMLVMRLGETLAKSLTTVSVAVVLFSALTSLMFKASNVETLAATAAYAAVLVVFVGTSS